MNNNGRAAGLSLVLLLIVALIVAYFAVTQLRGLRFDKPAAQQAVQQNAVDQAQDAVNALNDKMHLQDGE